MELLFLTERLGKDSKTFKVFEETSGRYIWSMNWKVGSQQILILPSF